MVFGREEVEVEGGVSRLRGGWFLGFFILYSSSTLLQLLSFLVCSVFFTLFSCFSCSRGAYATQASSFGMQ